MNKTIIHTLILAVGISLVAYAGEEKQPEDFVRVDKKITLEATEFKFKPEKLEIPVNTKVKIRLKNEGVIAHNLIVIIKEGEDAANPEITSIQKNETGETEVTFNETGTYHFYCNIPGHKEAGMRGMVRVVSE